MKIEDFLKLQITYKPGWEFRIKKGKLSTCIVKIIYKGEDAHLVGQATVQVPLFTLDQHVRSILARVTEMEGRQARLWFKINGECIPI